MQVDDGASILQYTHSEINQIIFLIDAQYL